MLLPAFVVQGPETVSDSLGRLSTIGLDAGAVAYETLVQTSWLGSATSPLSSAWLGRPRLSKVMSARVVRQLPSAFSSRVRLLAFCGRRATRAGRVERVGGGVLDVHAARVRVAVVVTAGAAVSVRVTGVPPAWV